MKREKPYRTIIIWSIVATLFVIAAWLFTLLYFKDLKPNHRGTFGDMFGSVNALFSGLAFTGIIMTILLQRKEFELQRDELADTREVLELQKEELTATRTEFEKQNSTMRI